MAIGYTELDFVNGHAPALSAANLNHIDEGVKACADQLDAETAPGRTLVEAADVAAQRTALDVDSKAEVTAKAGAAQSAAESTAASALAGHNSAYAHGNIPTTDEKTRLSDIQAAAGTTTSEKVTALVPAASTTTAGKTTVGASDGAAKLVIFPDSNVLFSASNGKWNEEQSTNLWSGGNGGTVSLVDGNMVITSDGSHAWPYINASIAGYNGKYLYIKFTKPAGFSSIAYYNGTSHTELSYYDDGTYIYVQWELLTSTQPAPIIYFKFSSAPAAGTTITVLDMSIGDTVMASGSVTIDAVDKMSGLCRKSDAVDISPGLPLGKQYVYRSAADTIYIAARFNSVYDILLKFDDNNLNHRMIMRYAGLALSKGFVTDANIRRTPSIWLNVIGNTDDNVGPFLFYGQSYWTGGGHQYPTNTANPKYPTADMISYEFTSNGIIIPQGKLIECDVVEVYGKHAIYDPTTVESGTNTVILYEHLMHVVRGGDVQIMCKLDQVIAKSMSTYYGLQLNDGIAWQNYIYYAHGADHTLHAINDAISAGTISTAPIAEKVITCNTDKSICCSLWMDLSVGMPTNRTAGVIGTNPVIFKASYNGGASWKLYWTLVNGYFSNGAGSTYFWRGGMNFFSNITSDASFVYKQWEGGCKYLIIDFIDIANGTYYIPAKEFANGTISVVSADDTLTVTTTIFPDGAKIAVTGYGNAKIKIA